MIKIGIDPGNLTGCVVIKATGLTTGWTIMPFKSTDYYEIDRILKNAKQASLRNSEEIKCVIEKVHIMPKQSAVSMNKFIENFGITKGILMSNGIPFKELAPQTWMKKLPVKKSPGDTRTTWKRKLKQLAKQECPDLNVTNINADAILMVNYIDKYF